MTDTEIEPSDGDMETARSLHFDIKAAQYLSVSADDTNLLIAKVIAQVRIDGAKSLEWNTDISVAPRDGTPVDLFVKPKNDAGYRIADASFLEGSCFHCSTGSHGHLHDTEWKEVTSPITHWRHIDLPKFTPPQEQCDHNWVDATNENVSGTELCLKCHSIRATPPQEKE